MKTTKKSTKKPSKSSKKSELAPSAVVGKTLPNLTLGATSGKDVSLSDLKGKKVVLYFYPKDNTPGCTLEGQDFKRLHTQFKKAGCEVFGISRDSLKSHESFKEKCGFPFELLVDVDEKLCAHFKVVVMKNMYGRKYEGIERSTYVVDVDGTVVKEWRKVKVTGHADEVLEFVKSI